MMAHYHKENRRVRHKGPSQKTCRVCGKKFNPQQDKRLYHYQRNKSGCCPECEKLTEFGVTGKKRRL